ncbi:MAG TPA: hypothetical protein VLB81_02030 [Gaiellales bacterium]|nr:hypothetical protein [Gaiellales bacterium]
MAPITPNWIALAGAGTAVLAGTLPPAAAVYLTTLSVAALMGAAFLAYLVAVDDPRRARMYEAAVCAVAGALLMGDLAVRVPGVVSGSAPAGAAKLAFIALALVIATLIAPMVPWPRLQARAGRGLRELLQR